MGKDKPSSSTNTFAGVWLSSYSYHHIYKDVDLRSEHYVRIYQAGEHLIVEAIPGVNRSYVLLRLSLDGNLATGTWTEETDPQGDFKGTKYYGALQLLVSDDSRAMNGRWVAFNKTGKVQTGVWDLTYVGEEVPGGLSRL